MADGSSNGTPAPAGGERWLDDEDNFVAVMIAVAAVLVLAGLVLVACMIRYPSFGLADKLGDLFDGDGDDDDKDGRASDAGSPKDTLGSATLKSAGLPPAAAVPSLRLPTPGGAAPANRLPPLYPAAAAPSSSPAAPGSAGAGSKELVLEEDLESILDASSAGGGSGGLVPAGGGLLRRSESADSGAVLDDLKPRIVGLSWSKEVASDIPSVGTARPLPPPAGAWTTGGRLPL